MSKLGPPDTNRQDTRQNEGELSRSRGAVSPDARRFIEQFMARHDEDMRNLARR